MNRLLVIGMLLVTLAAFVVPYNLKDQCASCQKVLPLRDLEIVLAKPRCPGCAAYLHSWEHEAPPPRGME